MYTAIIFACYKSLLSGPSTSLPIAGSSTKARWFSADTVLGPGGWTRQFNFSPTTSRANTREAISPAKWSGWVSAPSCNRSAFGERPRGGGGVPRVAELHSSLLGTRGGAAAQPSLREGLYARGEGEGGPRTALAPVDLFAVTATRRRCPPHIAEHPVGSVRPVVEGAPTGEPRPGASNARSQLGLLHPGWVCLHTR